MMTSTVWCRLYFHAGHVGESSCSQSPICHRYGTGILSFERLDSPKFFCSKFWYKFTHQTRTSGIKLQVANDQQTSKGQVLNLKDIFKKKWALVLCCRSLFCFYFEDRQTSVSLSCQLQYAKGLGVKGQKWRQSDRNVCLNFIAPCTGLLILVWRCLFPYLLQREFSCYYGFRAV